MIELIANNAGTIVVAVILTAAVAAVIAMMWRDRKCGKSLCGCKCSECAMRGACHKR